MIKDIKAVLSPSEYAALSLRALYYGKGYASYKMSKFEEYDLYAQNKDFLVSGSVITFTDTDGRLMALKPDVTLSIIKNTDTIPGETSRLYYNENVYRVAKGTNSFKEIPQAGVECIGKVGKSEVAEVVCLAVESLAVLSNEFVLELSSLDIVNAVCEAYGIGGKARTDVFEYLSAKNAGALTSLAKSCGLSEDKASVLCKLVELYGPISKVMGELAQFAVSKDASLAIEDFVAVLERVQKSEFAQSVCVDFSVVNDGAYYNGVAFRGFVFGAPTRVLSGGQYDGLMAKMGKSARGVGFAVYLDEIAVTKEADND